MATRTARKTPARGIMIAGRLFQGRSEAAAHYGRDLSTYAFFKKKYDATFEDWVTGKWDNRVTRSAITYRGRTFNSKAKLCAALDIPYNTIKLERRRLRLRYFQTAVRIRIARRHKAEGAGFEPGEEALLKAADRRLARIRSESEKYTKAEGFRATRVTFRGTTYESYQDLCATFQLSYNTIRGIRSKEKCSFEKAVETALTRRAAREIHAFGAVYDGLAELAHHKKVDLPSLKAAMANNPETSLEDLVRSLRAKVGLSKRTNRSLPNDPILFGWRFKSWKAAWEYWQPVGISQRQFYDHLAAGRDIDARCQHELIVQAERGNLTQDLRKVDQIGWSPEDGGPIERVGELLKFSLNERLSQFHLVNTHPTPKAVIVRRSRV